MSVQIKKNMHKFHTLQCKNNKLLLSNHHLLWCNIYSLWGSSSSVCDGEHFVLKIHRLLFNLAFKKYPSCSLPLEKYSGPLDNNRRDCNQWWEILAEMFLTNSWQNVVVTMVSMNQYISIMFEKCQFKSLWKLMIGVLY
jgi:hypothetical protein